MGKRSFFVCLLACGQIFSFLYSKVRKSTVQYRYLFGASIQYNTIHYNTIHYNTKYSTFFMVDSKTEGVCSERTQRTILRSFSYNTLQYKILNLFAKILNLLQIIVTVTGHRSRSE